MVCTADKLGGTAENIVFVLIWTWAFFIVKNGYLVYLLPGTNGRCWYLVPILTSNLDTILLWKGKKGARICRLNY